MFLVYNSDVLSEHDLRLSVNDRAFQYGDGLFETIRYENGRIWYWPDHFDRLTAGMHALQLSYPNNFTAETLSQRIDQLLLANRLIDQSARIKLQVWRQAGGLYTPSTNNSHVLLTARSGQPFSLTEKAAVGIYDAFRLTQSPVSSFKTLNALPYVLAGLYKQEHAYDDVILLDAQGNLAECLASNLFWFINQTLVMPSLMTGCVNGIIRRQFLRLAPRLGLSIDEGNYPLSVLEQAEGVFCANVMGIQWLRQIVGLSLKTPSEETTDLLNSLFAELQR